MSTHPLRSLIPVDFTPHRLCLDVLAHTNKTVLPYPTSPIRFRTFPDSRLPTGSHFRFVVSSCIQPNFPYAPFQNRRIRGFDLLADYLFAEPTIVNTPGAVAHVEASENVTEGPVPPVAPTNLETERIPPAEFMLFLVRGCFIPHSDGTLTRHRAILSTPTSQFTTAIPNMRTVVCTGATTIVQASVKSLSDFVRP